MPPFPEKSDSQGKLLLHGSVLVSSSSCSSGFTFLQERETETQDCVDAESHGKKEEQRAWAKDASECHHFGQAETGSSNHECENDGYLRTMLEKSPANRSEQQHICIDDTTEGKETAVCGRKELYVRCAQYTLSRIGKQGANDP